MNIHTEKAETNESPYGLTLSQVLGLSFFMTFGAALFASGVLAWRAHKRFAAVVLVIFSVVALGAYGLIYVFVPVPAAAAIFGHLIFNVAAGLIVFRIQRGVLAGARSYPFWGDRKSPAGAARTFKDMLCTGFLFYLIAIPYFVADSGSTSGSELLKMREVFSALYRSFYFVPPGLVIGFFWSRRRGGLGVSDIVYFFLASLVILIDFVILHAIYSGPVLGKSIISGPTDYLGIGRTAETETRAFFNVIYLLNFAIPPFVLCIYLSCTELASRFVKRHWLVFFLVFFTYVNGILIDHSFLDLMARRAETDSRRMTKQGYGRAARFNVLVADRAAGYPGAPAHLMAAASQAYNAGERRESEAIYSKILRRYGKRPGLKSIMGEAAFIKTSIGKSDGRAGLHAVRGLQPALREDYLTPNWLSLLTAALSRKGAPDEDRFKERLLKISKEDKSIKLSPVVSEADVLAALGFLGYEVYVTEADLAKLKKLVDSGIAPVVKMPLELRGGYEDIASKSRRKFDFSDFYYWRGNGDEPFTYGVVAGYDDSRGVIIMYDFRKAQPRSKKPLTEGEIKEIVYHRTGRDLIKDVNERRRELKGEVVREYAYPYFDEKWSEKGRNAIIILGERESPGALKKAGIAAADIESGTAAESLISRGDFYYREKDFFRALKLYQQAISVRDSKYAERMTALCAMRLSPKRPKKEWTRELDAYRGESEYVAWLADPENARAAREYSTAFIRDFERDRLDAAMLVKYGDMLYPANASERPKLKKIYKRLAAYDPGDTEPINNLIKMYMDEKDYRSALPLLSKAIKLSADAGYTEVDEEISMNRVRRALCLVELGGLKRAAEETEKIDPGDFYGEPDFRYVRGRLLMSKGKLKAARREFEKALSLKSGDAKSRLYLAKALLGLGDKKLAGLEAGIVIDMELSGPLLKEARRIARIAGRKSG